MPATSEKVRKSIAQLRREQRQAKERFSRARKAETGFARQLRSVARQIGALIKGFIENEAEIVVIDTTSLRSVLSRYSDLLTPWASRVAARMIAEVDRRDLGAWTQQSKLMGRNLRREIEKAPTGEMLRKYLSEQVDLITSLPRSAAERVHQMTLRGITEGTRAEEIKAKILETGRVTESRAMLIARTEVARTASALTMVRAQYVGSDGYIWRTARDSDVRLRHRKLEGKYIRWDSPPVAGESGELAHAGMIYNCRCYPEPVLQNIV
jgi:SPP1 gp7 family putative phage head morphogenesis protein